jgi:hypothetical protein
MRREKGLAVDAMRTKSYSELQLVAMVCLDLLSG